ncbi:Glyoxylase, beta-lactamase superfamily II [Alkalibacterium subtropicum]|uniref:Glyoxylase, beta-lactamase superfamily II n=1 Tax=Alkalibacterium subtropicum TaxID=753702 RepID=A0A1I1KRA5_9LACT|nr:MBL fold metallo-hydrolase [Alkalibacterium subtropicum]SFC63125.1 Glyoxylase, beta-lactamase superfamily II [Alkalibacterium subtropicum]
MDNLKFHDMTLYWLDGGVVSFDGGAIFGVVPKPLWNRKYPANEKNQITHATEPILIQYQGKNYLIDTGIGKGKLTEKQKRNFGVQEESRIDENLAELGLTKEDIDGVLMTHMHFDHATGLTHSEDGKFVSTYPNAVIYMTETEWDEVRHPNIRSKSSYWKQNWEAIQGQVRTFEKELEVVPGITMTHTGGHSNGHAIVKLDQDGETIMHMADIMASTAHQNPLWVMAYDDYPMDSIYAKQEWMQRAYQNNYKFIFYHDAYYRMIQWDEEGKEIVDMMKRSKA